MEARGLSRLCRPNVIHVEIDDAGDVRVCAER
jgi:hypothetical protein